MTDDEISELAECLWDACREAERPIRPITGSGEKCICPLWAAGIGSGGLAGSVRMLEEEDAGRFIEGFDGFDEWPDGFCHGMGRDENDPLTQLGARFREQALSGEGFR